MFFFMSGHSKWANIKHKKAAADSKKGKVFTRMAKLITVAAQQGGGDPDTNPTLRVAIQKAKSAGVPNDNIERAVKKGTGELKGDRLEEVIYEGYGPEGVAILILALTDNTNRSLTNVRTIMTKNHGNLGGSGCVAWMFERKGIIEADKVTIDHDAFELELIDAGADDVFWEGAAVRVQTSPEAFEQCLKVFNNLPVQKSEISLVPQEEKEVNDVQKGKEIVHLIELLEDDEDVDEVFTNASFSESVLKSL
ncbi:MAG: YebC/PmpR family DNA-binding transcriptional regulator [bacterium]|nr:YebC/PmpR family DNA-binding transcriptional regulator [bacterium]